MVFGVWKGDIIDVHLSVVIYRLLWLDTGGVLAVFTLLNYGLVLSI